MDVPIASNETGIIKSIEDTEQEIPTGTPDRYFLVKVEHCGAHSWISFSVEKSQSSFGETGSTVRLMLRLTGEMYVLSIRICTEATVHARRGTGGGGVIAQASSKVPCTPKVQYLQK